MLYSLLIPSTLYFFYRLDWRPLVGDDTVKHAACFLSESRQPGYRFSFFFLGGGRSQLVVELERCAGWRTFTPHKGNDRIAY